MQELFNSLALLRNPSYIEEEESLLIKLRLNEKFRKPYFFLLPEEVRPTQDLLKERKHGRVPLQGSSATV